MEVNAFASSVSLHIGYSSRYEIEGSKGSKNFGTDTHSSKLVISTVEKLYNEIVKDYPIRRVTITLNNVVYDAYVQYDFFTDLNEQEKEDKMQHAVLDIKKKFGKNSILRGINFEEGATMRDRNVQIGGHKSGE